MNDEHNIVEEIAQQDATIAALKALRDDIRKEGNRKLQVWLSIAVVLNILFSLFLGWKTQERFCEAINDNRDTIHEILVTIAQADDGQIDAEEQRFFDLLQPQLEHLDC